MPRPKVPDDFQDGKKPSKKKPRPYTILCRHRKWFVKDRKFVRSEDYSDWYVARRFATARQRDESLTRLIGNRQRTDDGFADHAGRPRGSVPPLFEYKAGEP